MWQFIIDNIELFTGIFLGFVLTVLLFLIYQIFTYNHSTTSIEIIDEYEDGSMLVECWDCGSQTTIPKGIKLIHYCPGCGKEVGTVWK